MIDILKKTFYAGVGATVVTADKVEAAMQDLVQKGKISTEEAKATARKIVDDGRREFEESRQKLQDVLSEWLNKAPVARRDELQQLETRLAALEAKLKSLHPDA